MNDFLRSPEWRGDRAQKISEAKDRAVKMARQSGGGTYRAILEK